MIVSMILATGKNFEIGSQGKLPWHWPEDLKFFKRTTHGHCLVMGRKTFESIGRPLPHRTTMIITRQSVEQIQGQTQECLLMDSLQAAILYAKETLGESELFICGGAEIYEQALSQNLVDRIYWSQIEQTYPEADRFFTPLAAFAQNQREKNWKLMTHDQHEGWSFRLFQAL